MGNATSETWDEVHRTIAKLDADDQLALWHQLASDIYGRSDELIWLPATRQYQCPHCHTVYPGSDAGLEVHEFGMATVWVDHDKFDADGGAHIAYQDVPYPDLEMLAIECSDCQTVVKFPTTTRIEYDL